jgi:hypothetical protein
MEPTPLRVEQDRCNFEGKIRLDASTDLQSGAAHAQAVRPLLLPLYHQMLISRCKGQPFILYFRRC